MKAIARGEGTGKLRRFRDVVDSMYFHVSLLVVCVGLMGWATFEGWRRLVVLDDFSVREISFSIRSTDGVKPGLLREIKNTRGIIGRSLFERGLTKDVVQALERNPWVLRVNFVKKDFPDKLSVGLELRKPSAVFRKNGVFYLLDDEGVVLPTRYFSWPSDQGKTPYIQSARITRTPRAGERLEDAGIKAGIELVKFLKANNAHRLLGIKVVDVSNVGRGRSVGESDIVLWTKDGVAIKWGCPPQCQQVDELSDSEKLKNLYSVVKAEGSRLAHMEYIDVRWRTPRGKRR